AADGGGGADHEREPASGEALCDERGQALLQDGHLALAQARDLLAVDLTADDVVAEPGEAGRRRQPDVPAAHDRDRAHDRRARVSIASGRAVGPGPFPSLPPPCSAPVPRVPTARARPCQEPTRWAAASRP